MDDARFAGAGRHRAPAQAVIPSGQKPCAAGSNSSLFYSVGAATEGSFASCFLTEAKGPTRLAVKDW